MIAEAWHPIPGFQMYEVSDAGRVRSFTRCITRPLADGDSPPVVMKSRSCHGYRTVNLRSGGRYWPKLIHRLVLETFVGPCPVGMECRHLNGIRDDNRVINLAWGTKLENAQDQQTHGTQARGDRHSSRTKPECISRGSQNGRVKIDESTVYSVRTCFDAKLCNTARLGRIHGISKQHARRIGMRQSWSHLPELSTLECDAARVLAGVAGRAGRELVEGEALSSAELACACEGLVARLKGGA